MPSRDSSRHHRRSIRLPGYDYTQPGAYFVTVVTHRRAHLFGEVVNGDMRLNAWGDIVRDEWFKTAHIRPYVQLRDDEFVVMPNHIHGIIWIVGSPDIVGATRRVAPTMDAAPGSSGAAPGPSGAAPTEPRGPIPQSIGAIIGQFKSIVTKRIYVLDDASGTLIWQRNYYEHIVRHERALNAIRRYIIDNPRRWHLDRENIHRTGSDPLAHEIWAMFREDDRRCMAEGDQ